MEPPYRGFCPEEQERQPPFFQRGPPPPPPRGEEDFGRGYGGKNEFYAGGFPPEGDRFGQKENGYGGRSGSPPEGDRFEQNENGYGGRSGFPPQGDRFEQNENGYDGRREDGYQEPAYAPAFHRRHCEDAPVPSGDGGAPAQAGYQSDGQSSDECVPAKAGVVDDTAAVSSDMNSMSLSLPQGRLLKIFCKQDSAFNLTVDHKSLEMQAANTEDEAQQWIKDASHGFRIKDNYGQPAFSLVNKKTKKVLKYSKKEGQQVLLVDYQADMNDDNILWTESQDFGEGFKTIRAASDTLLNLTVFEGYKKIRNGSALMLDTWHKGDHQLWTLAPL